MSKRLLLAFSNQTIFNSIAIKENYFRNDDIDLLIIVLTNAAAFDYNLYKIIASKKLFNKVYIIDKNEIDSYLKTFAKTKMKRLFYSRYLQKYLNIKLLFLKNKKYNQFICPMFCNYVPNIINAIMNLQNSNKVNIRFYEEGTATYAFSLKELSLFSIYMIKFSLTEISITKRLKTIIKCYLNEFYQYYKLKNFIDDYLYLYWPEHLKFANNNYLRLRQVERTQILKEVYKEYSETLDYIKINRYKKCNIIFINAYVPSTYAMQISVINKVLERCNTMEFIIKTHPASTKNREKFFDDLKNEKIFVDRDAYYFEALNMQIDFTNKMIISIDSSIIMNFKTIFNTEPYIIMLYRLTSSYYTDEVYRENTDRYISDLKKSFDNSYKIVVPNNVYEFDYYFSLFKSEIEENKLINRQEN